MDIKDLRTGAGEGGMEGFKGMRERNRDMDMVEGIRMNKRNVFST